VTGTLRASRRPTAPPVLALGLVVCANLPASAQDDAQIVLHLLDYVAVDYAAAVAGNQVIDEAEYLEMREFSARAIEEIGRLPANTEREALALTARELARRIESRTDPPMVAAAARRLRTGIIDAYGVSTAPRHPPDTALGRRIYAENCASCHGEQGRGDGPAAVDLDPAPSDFHDGARMAERSLYGIYSTITLGIDGTSMASFAELREEERWSVAAWVAGLGRGPGASGLERTCRLLAESVAAYREGRNDQAQRLALRAYLDGFEPLEAGLTQLDRRLVRDTEQGLMGLRAALRRGAAVDEIERRRDEIESDLARARQLLDGDGLSAAAMLSASFLILLREGLEAILVLAAVIAFVKKAGRRDALPYVHAGWIGACVLGLVTWLGASYAIEISGANREISEGVTALLAAATLVYVGYWLHNKAYARAWTRFIREQVGGALSRRTWWAMAAVAFLAVYREIFEIVLFYQALWAQAGGQTGRAFVGGVLAGLVALTGLAWLVFRFSVRLPIGPFFAVTSILLASMAVVFAGQGVAALQEAGVVSITPLSFPDAPVVGLFPTAQTLAAQAAMALIVVASFILAGRAARADVEERA